MSAKSEEYRRRAEQAEERARNARDLDLRQAYADIARQWREMAAQAERQRW